MFENYTKSASQTIFFARFEVSAYGGLYLEPHHLLIGLLRAESRLARAFGLTIDERTGIDLGPIRQKIAEITPSGPKIDPQADIPLSEATKKVFASAADETQRLGHPHTDTLHLFLGLVTEGGEIVAQILREHGLYPENEQARDQMAVVLAKIPHPPRIKVRRPTTAIFAPDSDLSAVLKRASEIAGIPVSLHDMLRAAAELFPQAVINAAETLMRSPERGNKTAPQPDIPPPDTFEA